MLIGYMRVSTGEQNPDAQRDVLLRAGVAEENLYVDHTSGAQPRARSGTWPAGCCAPGTC